MKQLINNNGNRVISIEQWKKTAGKFKEEQDLKRYFKMLSFNELINESNIIIDQLGDSYEQKDHLIYQKASLVLLEMNSRLEKESSQMANGLKKMREKIECKIIHFNNPEEEE